MKAVPICQKESVPSPLAERTYESPLTYTCDCISKSMLASKIPQSQLTKACYNILSPAPMPVFWLFPLHSYSPSSDYLRSNSHSVLVSGHLVLSAILSWSPSLLALGMSRLLAMVNLLFSLFFSLCSRLFQMSLALLSLISIMQTLTIAWSGHAGNFFTVSLHTQDS